VDADRGSTRTGYKNTATMKQLLAQSPGTAQVKISLR